MSQIAFFIESFRVYWFGIIIAAALVAAVIIAILCRRAQKKDSRAVFFVAVVGGMLSLFLARIIHWYCSTGQYADFHTAVTDLKNGGFSILGAFLGCVIAVLFAKYISVEDNISELLDCIAPGGAIGICIGRMGSVFTSSDRGKLIITNPAFQRFPFAVQISGDAGADWQFATFVFESIAALITFFVVMNVFSSIYIAPKRGLSPRKGDAALTFIAFFSATQAVLESTRYDALFLRSNGFVSMMQVVCSIALVAVLVVFSVRAVKKTGRQNRYIIMWVFSVALIGVAMLFEYLVQRYGDLSVYFYFGMLACMLCVYGITCVFYRYAIEETEPEIRQPVSSRPESRPDNRQQQPGSRFNGRQQEVSRPRNQQQEDYWSDNHPQSDSRQQSGSRFNGRQQDNYRPDNRQQQSGSRFNDRQQDNYRPDNRQQQSGSRFNDRQQDNYRPDSRQQQSGSRSTGFRPNNSRR